MIRVVLPTQNQSAFRKQHNARTSPPDRKHSKIFLFISILFLLVAKPAPPKSYSCYIMIQGVAKPAPPESSLLHFSLLVCARSSSPKPSLRWQYASVSYASAAGARGSPPREWSAACRCISSCHCCSLSTPTLTKEDEPISPHEISHLYWYTKIV